MKTYSAREVATMLAVSPQCVSNWIRAGKLPASRQWRNYRIDASALKTFKPPKRGRPKAMKRKINTKPDTCLWQQDGDGIYQTGCDNAFLFESDGIEANKFVFCSYCGGRIEEANHVR